MALRRRTASRSRISAPRRKRVWARYSTDQTVAGGTPFRDNLLANFETALGANLIGATVARIRGAVVTVPGGGSPADAQGIMAIRVGNAGEVTSLNLGPNGAPYEDWMAWEPFISSANAAQVYGADTVARMVDVKAMRKLEEIDQELQIWFDGTPLVSFSFQAVLSVLVLLP